jgi:integrase
MPTKKLTDLFVERVKPPPSGRIEYFDASFGGLALRVTEKGHKSWSLYYRRNGKRGRYTIGPYPAVKPVDARREAMATLERVRAGIDPSAEKRGRRLRPGPESDTFAKVLDDHLERHLKKNTVATTHNEIKRMLKRDALPLWQNWPISTITRRDVIDLIDAIVERGAPVQANRMLTRLGALFNWAVQQDRLASSPIAGMKPPSKERSRDRALIDDEIRWFWAGCEEIGWPFGPLFKLLLLTGQRRDEVGGIEWADLDLPNSLWNLPRYKAKNNRAHHVHLSAPALEILSSLPRVGNGLVFTTNGITAVSGFGRAKRRLDRAMLDERGEGDASTIPPWTLHDLRRTAATGMARLNIAPHVLDRVLNHVSGRIRGVAAVYNRFEYLDERKAALERWGNFVATNFGPGDSQ